MREADAEFAGFFLLTKGVYHLKATTQRVAVALRRMVVKGIVALHRRLGGYPLAQGVGAGAGAGGPGGPGG